MENSQTAPKWIVIYLWIATILTFVFSIMAYLKPEALFSAWPAISAVGALSLAGPLGLFVARNLATGVTSVFAILNKSINALMVAFVLRAVTDGLDLIHNSIAGNMPVAILALVMLVIEVIALVKLKKLNLV